MLGRLTQDRRPMNRTNRRRWQPSVDGLEDRMLLYATTGGLWSQTARITYSFVPDGTSVGGVASSLYSTLNVVASTAAWQQAIEKAAAVWSSYANINLALVPDAGTAFGTSGNQQNDPRFGDIRIAAIPQAPGYLGFATLPPAFNGGPNAGDIVLNSTSNWGVNTNYDVETVAIHEFGHALGMDHSAITGAVMYAYYNATKQGLASDDTAGIQSVYGAYPGDTSGNGGFATALNVTALIDGNNQIALSGQNIAGTSDLDYYVVTVPAGTNGTMTVSMQSTNLSSLTPKVVVYNGSKVGIGQTSLPTAFGGTATYTVNGVTAGQTYYVRASAAASPGAYGAFGLLVNFGGLAQAPIAPPNTTVAQQPDAGGGSLGDSVGPWGSAVTAAWNSLTPGQQGALSAQVLDLTNATVISFGNLSAWGDPLEVRGVGHGAGHTSAGPKSEPKFIDVTDASHGTPVAPCYAIWRLHSIPIALHFSAQRFHAPSWPKSSASAKSCFA